MPNNLCVAAKGSKVQHLLMFLLTAFLLSACAIGSQYKATPAPIPQIKSMPFWHEENGLMVGADPYVQPERQQAMFDADMTSQEILPIQLLIENHGDQSLWILRSDIFLELPSGINVYVWRIHEIMEPHNARLLNPFAFSLLWPIALPFAFQDASKVDTWFDRLRDCSAKEFKGGLLRKNESNCGFLFFYVPNLEDNATLTLRFVKSYDASSLVIHLPLNKLTSGRTAEKDITPTNR